MHQWHPTPRNLAPHVLRAFREACPCQGALLRATMPGARSPFPRALPGARSATLGCGLAEGVQSRRGAGARRAMGSVNGRRWRGALRAVGRRTTTTLAEAPAAGRGRLRRTRARRWTLIQLTDQLMGPTASPGTSGSTERRSTTATSRRVRGTRTRCPPVLPLRKIPMGAVGAVAVRVTIPQDPAGPKAGQQVAREARTRNPASCLGGSLPRAARRPKGFLRLGSRWNLERRGPGAAGTAGPMETVPGAVSQRRSTGRIWVEASTRPATILSLRTTILRSAI